MNRIGDRDLRVIHHHPGRLRVRAEAFVEDQAAVERVKVGVGLMQGVRSIGHDARTGSLLVEYDARTVMANDLIDSIAGIAGLELSSKAPPRRDLGSGIVSLFCKVDDLTSRLTKGRLDLGVLVPGGLLGLGVYSFLHGPHRRMPRWDSLVYWAYAILSNAHGGASRARP